MNEIVTYIADEMRQEVNAYSRQGRSHLAVYQSHDISIASGDHNNLDDVEHRRESSISRLLGKQTSDKRLHVAGLKTNQKNSISTSLLSKSTKPIQLRNRPTGYVASPGAMGYGGYNSNDSVNENDPIPRIHSGLTNLPGNESSFSYLPSIRGVHRGKLTSGASADIVASGRQRIRYNGVFPKTGKNPLLMNSMRRLGNEIVVDVQKSNGIRLVDPVRAREMLANRKSSQERDIKITVSSAEKQNNVRRNQQSRKRLDDVKVNSSMSLAHRPTVNNLFSPNNKAKEQVFR